MTQVTDLQAALDRARAAVSRVSRSHVYIGLGVLLVACLLGWLALREFRSALSWGELAGKPIVLHPIKAERDGDVIDVPRPDTTPCPASVKKAINKKGEKALTNIGVDPQKESVLSTAELPKAPYGADTATTINNTTGLVETKALIRNPLLYADNRWELLFGGAARYEFDPKAKDGRKLVSTLHLGGSWEAGSLRLGQSGYRLYVKPSAHLLAIGGPPMVLGLADFSLHRP